MKDATALDAAIDAFDAGDRRHALRQLRRVGSNAYHAYLSAEAMEDYLGYFAADKTADSWGSASHLTASPSLWTEMSTLDGSAATPLHESALRQALVAARDEAHRELDRRLSAMAAAVATDR